MTSPTRIRMSEDRLSRTPTRQDNASESPSMAESANPILQMQRQQGNQFVLRKLSERAAATVQRDGEEEEMPATSGDNTANTDAGTESSIGSTVGGAVGGAVDWMSDTLGLTGMGQKVKQTVGKTQEKVNAGIDWGIDKVRGGVRKVEDWMDS